MRFSGVVALDGPSGTGKSTVARRLATRLGVRYLDTGAMYRAATLAVLRAGMDAGDPADAEKVPALVADAAIDVSTDPASPRVSLDGDPVDGEIRGRAGDRGCQRGVRAAGSPQPARRAAAHPDR